MKFINVSYKEFLKRKGTKKIIQFGASSAWHYYLKLFPDITSEILEDTLYVIDNNPSKQDKTFKIDRKEFEVKDPNGIVLGDDCVILITVSLAYHKAICEQLLKMNLPKDVECFSLPLMTYSLDKANNDCVDDYFQKHKCRVNTPKIHSFWFSGEEKPELYKRCLESWYKFCPDFEIIEWNTTNYDVTKNQYMKEAFERRKWAFVSDYARLDVLYQYGGIYFDMDVELLASPTRLLNADSFFCRQEDGFIELGSGFGAQAGDPLIQEMLNTYNNRRLILEDGTIDMTPQPEWLSDIMRRHGLGIAHDSEIVNGRLILSNDYITCSSVGNPLEKAKLGVHWHNGGWQEEKDRKLTREAFVAKEEVVKNFFNNSLQ